MHKGAGSAGRKQKVPIITKNWLIICHRGLDDFQGSFDGKKCCSIPSLRILLVSRKQEADNIDRPNRRSSLSFQSFREEMPVNADLFPLLLNEEDRTGYRASLIVNNGF